MQHIKKFNESVNQMKELTIEQQIRIILQNEVEELYYRVEGIDEDKIESIVSKLLELIENNK